MNISGKPKLDPFSLGGLAEVERTTQGKGRCCLTAARQGSPEMLVVLQSPKRAQEKMPLI